MDNFEEYLRQGEPNKAEKAKVWKTAIGLQQVDGLKPSDYLIATAKQNIEGEITLDEVKQRIDTYYKQHPAQTNEDRTEEADKVSARIAEILREHLEMHIQYNEPVNDPVNAKNDPVNDLVNDPVKGNILQQLKQNPNANYSELANKTGYSTATIKRHIQELKKMGMIESIGSAKTGYWNIINQ